MGDDAARNTNQQENVEQPRGENEQARAWNAWTTLHPIGICSHLLRQTPICV
jgi:hypothetical protein